MTIVKFTATSGFKFYHDNPNWSNGDERDVPADKAKYLAETFPDNFKIIAGEKGINPPPQNKADKGPGKNK